MKLPELIEAFEQKKALLYSLKDRTRVITVDAIIPAYRLNGTPDFKVLGHTEDGRRYTARPNKLYPRAV